MQNGFLNRISSPAGHFTDVSRAAGALLDGAPQNISPRPPLGITLRHSRTALSSGIYPRHHRRAPSHSAPAPKKNGWQLAKPTSSRPPAFSHGITLRHHRRAFSHSIVVWHLPPASPQGILAQHCRLAFTLGITAGHSRIALSSGIYPRHHRTALSQGIIAQHCRLAFTLGITAQHPRTAPPPPKKNGWQLAKPTSSRPLAFPPKHRPRHHRPAASSRHHLTAFPQGITAGHSRLAFTLGIPAQHPRTAPRPHHSRTAFPHSAPAPQKKRLAVGKANLQPPPSITAQPSPARRPGANALPPTNAPPCMSQ